MSVKPTSGAGNSGQAGEAPAEEKAPRNKPLPGTDLFNEKGSPEAQIKAKVGDSGMANITVNQERTKKSNTDHDQLRDGKRAAREERLAANPDFVELKPGKEGWKEADNTYMPSPDQGTLANKENDNPLFGREQIESGLAAFESEGGAVEGAPGAPEGVSSAGMGTLEASKTAVG
ncbi:MAG: hypothetical protein Q7T11_06160 [Deltaproteobacteria bacterium]|nr:hypothetical protein [Deltaproteobacteria bacterium]